VLYQALEYLVNAASGGMALGEEDIKIADYVKFSQDNLEALIKLARKVNTLWAKRKEIVKQKEAAARLAAEIEAALKALEAERTAAEAEAEKQRQKEEEEKERLEAEKQRREEANLEGNGDDGANEPDKPATAVTGSIGDVPEATTEVPEVTTSADPSRPTVPLKQNSDELKDIPHMKLQGCNFRMFQSIAELTTGLCLTPEEIKAAVEVLQNTPSKVNPKVMVIDDKFFVNAPNQVMDDAFERLGSTITATADYGKKDQEPDYYRLRGDTQLGNRHSVLLNSNKELLYDPNDPPRTLTNTEELRKIYVHRPKIKE
jgi:hypothetical protein